MISPLHTILGGLALTAQLLNQISSCVDVIFPKRLSSSDFGLNAPSTEYQFVKKLTRLNVNVAHLCLSFNLSIEKSTEALHNLAQFLAYYQSQGALSQAYPLENLHDLSVNISKEFEHPAIITEELDSDQEEDSFNTEDDSWESVVPSDMTIVHPLLSAAQQSSVIPNSPSPPPHSHAMSIVAGSFMGSWLRGIASPNSPNSPHK